MTAIKAAPNKHLSQVSWLCWFFGGGLSKRRCERCVSSGFGGLSTTHDLYLEFAQLVWKLISCPCCSQCTLKHWNLLCCFTGTSGASGRDWPPWTLRTAWSSRTKWALYSRSPGKTLLMCVFVSHLGHLYNYMIISSLTYCKHNLAPNCCLTLSLKFNSNVTFSSNVKVEYVYDKTSRRKTFFRD